MVKHLIKICGIKDAHVATIAVKAGANYIGLVFHPASPRHVQLEEAIKIAEATELAGGIPVAVFVNQIDVEMHSICEATNIKTVQLHGKTARNYHHLLPQDYQRIYVQSELQDDDNLHELDPDRDFILIDHATPGQGKRIDWRTFRYSLPFRWLLAGGLTPTNVSSAIHLLQPGGVDVSSGVESSRGHKDVALIQKFIKVVEGCYAE